MSIHLLAISRLRLEVNRKGLTIEESIASYNTAVNPFSQNVQKRGLNQKKIKFSSYRDFEILYLASARLSH